jgi:peptide/nickel transport system ATP-binding protein
VIDVDRLVVRFKTASGVVDAVRDVSLAVAPGEAFVVIEQRVLLLDEPTSALDVSVQAEVLNLLRRLHRTRGLTMLLVSHNFAVVGFLCDRLAVMREGAIVERTSVEALRSGQVTNDYTRTLLRATQGYRRDGPQ